MKELIDIAFSPVNIVLSILLILLIIYWILTMISGIDFDLDVDIDVDIDSDIDIDTDTGIEGGNMDFQDISNTEVNKEDIVGKRRRKLKWWQILLIYFNFVGLPFMFTFTCWIFTWWLLTTISTTLTNSYNNSFGYIIFIGGIIPSLILTKVMTTPFKSFFKNLNKDGDDPHDFVGRKGVLLSTISGTKLGSAEISVDSNSFSLYVKSLNGESLNYGETILIIKQSEDKNYYYVQSYND